jgi:hypothetical protein
VAVLAVVAHRRCLMIMAISCATNRSGSPLASLLRISASVRDHHRILNIRPWSYASHFANPSMFNLTKNKLKKAIFLDDFRTDHPKQIITIIGGNCILTHFQLRFERKFFDAARFVWAYHNSCASRWMH